MSPARGSRIKQWWLPALLVTGLVLFFASGAHQAISWQMIALHYRQITAFTEANLALAAASFLLLYAVAVAFSLPVALPLTLTGGAIFGWLAVLLVLVGATAGAGVVFIAARTTFADLARRRAGPFMARLEDGFSRNAFSYLLALRLIPAAPFWVVNIVPALTRMPFRSYLAATFIGVAPGSAVFVSVGRSLDHVLAAGRTPDLEILRSPAILGPLAALGLLALMPIAWKKFTASRYKGDGL
jgi:uncharacterized membrane protein YdjX (TVP38/TMEM64 family)